jgi:Retinal pigment epithelial membrane protein
VPGPSWDTPRDKTSYLLPAGRNPSEASFAPADDRAGGPGWLLSYVYDPATDRSNLVVFDADDLAAGPVAEIHLPQRVPAGFHGNWLPDARPRCGAVRRRVTVDPGDRPAAFASGPIVYRPVRGPNPRVRAGPVRSSACPHRQPDARCAFERAVGF